MSYGSNGAVIEQEKNQEWRTLDCKWCHEKKPCRIEDYRKDVDGLDPFQCDDCKEKMMKD